MEFWGIYFLKPFQTCKFFFVMCHFFSSLSRVLGGFRGGKSVFEVAEGRFMRSLMFCSCRGFKRADEL